MQFQEHKRTTHDQLLGTLRHHGPRSVYELHVMTGYPLLTVRLILIALVEAEKVRLYRVDGAKVQRPAPDGVVTEDRQAFEALTPP